MRVGERSGFESEDVWESSCDLMHQKMYYKMIAVMAALVKTCIKTVKILQL